MEPQNSLVSDFTGVELPEMPVDDSAKVELEKRKKYSKTKEYRELRAKAQERIEFYKHNLPAGYNDATAERKAQMWGFANLMIAEFEQLFSEHENADELLKDLFPEPYER